MRLRARAIEAGRLGAIRFMSIDRLRTEPAGAGGSGGKWRASAASGGGILIDHGWHVFYLMNWLLGGERPVSISARLESPAECEVDDVADVRIRFGSGAFCRAHLSWRAPVRRTSALIYGERASIEIEGDRVMLTDRSGKVEDLSVAEIADDSYHSAWFDGVAEEFERAVTEGTDSPTRKAQPGRGACCADANRCGANDRLPTTASNIDLSCKIRWLAPKWRARTTYCLRADRLTARTVALDFRDCDGKVSIDRMVSRNFETRR